MKNDEPKQQYDQQGYRLFRGALDAGQVSEQTKGADDRLERTTDRFSSLRS